MASPIAAGAMRIGRSLVGGFQTIGRGVASVGKGTATKTAQKLKAKNEQLELQKKKNAQLEQQVEDEIDRREKEGELERKRPRGRRGGIFRGLGEKVTNSFVQILVAWALENLPKLIKEAEKTIKKIRIFSSAVKNAIIEGGKVFNGLVNITKAFIQNLAEFDFTDKSERIKEAKAELDQSFEDMKTNFDEMKNVWNREEEELDKIIKKLENSQTLADAVAAADSGRDGATPTTPAVGAGAATPTTSSGPAGWGPILELIAQAESVGGSYDSVYPGRIKAGLSQMTIKEADAWQAATASSRGSAAAGRYQFMNILDQAQLAGLGPNDIFSPSNQDKMAIALIEKKRGVSKKMIKDNPTEAAKRLAMEWAGLPVLGTTAGANRTVQAGQSYYSGDSLNKATVSTKELTGAFTSSMAPPPNSGGGGAQKPTPAPAGGGGNFELTDKVPFSQFSKSRAEGGTGAVGKTSSYGPRVSPGGIGSTNHKGVDIGTSGQGDWYCGILVNGTVTYTGTRGGYGKLVIIKSGKYEYRFAHLAKYMVKAGQYVSGSPIGEIGNTGHSTGTHLHFEVLINGKHIDPEPYLNLLEIGRLKKTVSSKNTTINRNKRGGGRSGTVEQVSSLPTDKNVQTILVRQQEIILT